MANEELQRPLPSNVNEAAKEYASTQLGNEHDEYFSVDVNVLEAFKTGAEWRQSNLWHPADGNYLPEIDREVIVFTQTERQYPKVAIAHTMPLGDWKQFDGNRYYLERNGEVGWSLPDVKIWLDCDLPYEEGGEE